MSARKRAARVLVAGVFCVTLLGASAATAAAAEDESEFVDVSKTVSELHKKMGELREHGRYARKGELSAGAVCDEGESERVFWRFGDPALYTPAPEGDIEQTDGWALNKHVRRAENSPFGEGESSLFLEDHGEAISPPMCVSVAHPTIRMFAANTGGEESQLEVEILYEGLDGKIKTLRVARLRAGNMWAPTAVIPLYVNILGAATEDGFTAIAVKFKARDVKRKDAGWKIDDLFVDPLKVW